MTAQAPQAPPLPATPYVPAWALYVYDGRAFLTFDVRLQATATCRTPAQLARLVDLQDRLNSRLMARASAQATRVAIDRRPEPAI